MTNLLNEEEAVGTVAAPASAPMASAGGARQTPARTSDPVASREQMEPHGYRRKGRARILERSIEEEDEEEEEEEGEGHGRMDIDEEEELRLGTLGLEDEDEDEEMST